MHELGITQNIIELAIEYAQGAKIRQVTLEIGKLTAIQPHAIEFCFDVCCRGTILEGSALKIIEKPGLGRCRQCGSQIPLEIPFGVCDCGSIDLDLIQGQEIQLKELELEELCA